MMEGVFSKKRRRLAPFCRNLFPEVAFLRNIEIMLDTRTIFALFLTVLLSWAAAIVPTSRIPQPSGSPTAPGGASQSALSEALENSTRATAEAEKARGDVAAGLETVKQLVSEIPTKEYVEVQIENTKAVAATAAESAAAMKAAIDAFKKSGLLKLDPSVLTATTESIKVTREEMAAIKESLKKTQSEVFTVQEDYVAASKEMAAVIAQAKKALDTSAIASLQNDLKAMKEAMKQSASEKTETSEKMSKQVSELSNKIDQIQGQAETFATKVEVATISGRVSEMSPGLEALRTSTATLGGQLSALQAKLDALGGAQDRHATAIKVLNGNQQQLSDSYKSLYDSTIKILTQLQEIKTGNSSPSPEN